MKNMIRTTAMTLLIAILCMAFGACDDGSGSKGGAGDTPITVPDAPGAARVTPADSQLALEWDAVEGATAYEVWYGETNDSGAATRHGGDITATNDLITGLDNGTPYYIWLRAKNTAGTSGFGDVASGTPEEALVAPEAPGAAAVTSGDTQLTLEWDAVEGATFYEVWYSETNDSVTATEFTGDSDSTDLSCVITGLVNGTPYYVWIMACNPVGESDLGPVAIGTPDIDPAAVSGLTATTTVDHVTLAWTDPASFTLDHIEITWTPHCPFAVIVNPGTQGCDIGMLADGTAYTFTVTCVFDDESTVDATVATTGEVPVSTAAELDDVRSDLAAHYILMADIDLSAYAPWTPIGTDAARFTGNLNGNGHIISNLTISGASDNQGLFGFIGADGGVIDLSLVNVSVSGANHVGALAGWSYGAVSRCSATGAVSGASDTGGLLGTNDGAVSNSHAACAVLSNGWWVGGLVGAHHNTGLISYCYAAGKVEGVSCVGGLVGGNSGATQNSYATGKVVGTDQYAGGLVGRNYEGLVTNCYATGPAIGNQYVGGLAGRNYSGRTIENCYSTGLVDGNQNVGGLIGENAGTVNSSYYYRAPNNGIGTSLTEGQMKDSANYSGWNFTSLWRIDGDVNRGFPYLVTRPNAVNGLAAVTTATSVTLTWADPEAGGFDQIEVTWEPDGSTVHEVSAGTGSYTAAVNADGVARTFTVRTVYANGTVREAAVCTTGVVEIGTANELNAVRNNPGYYYMLMTDVDLTSYPWTPFTFSGTFDGNGNVISNLTIDTTANEQGLFSGISGTVTNLGLEDIDVRGGAYVGGLAGRNDGTVSNCYTTGYVSGIVAGDSFNPAIGSQNVGGLIGYNGIGRTVSNCYSNCSVSGVSLTRYIGGLVGANYYGTVSGCYATGPVSGNASSSVGGLVGYSYGTVNNCYATGSVSGGTSIYVGGLTGNNGDHGAINNCYATGPVSSSSSSVGGLVGILGTNATVSNGYYDSQTTLQSDTGKGEPRTTTQMKTQSTFTGWDFTDIWSIDTSGSVNSGYPYLTNNH